jgi:hypothetical protein
VRGVDGAETLPVVVGEDMNLTRAETAMVGVGDLSIDSPESDTDIAFDANGLVRPLPALNSDRSRGGTFDLGEVITGVAGFGGDDILAGEESLRGLIGVSHPFIGGLTDGFAMLMRVLSFQKRSVDVGDQESMITVGVDQAPPENVHWDTSGAGLLPWVAGDLATGAAVSCMALNSLNNR